MEQDGSQTSVAVSREPIAPRTETERTLVKIWTDVLRLERIGIHDDFIALGGHSLSATLCVGRIVEAYGVEVPLDAFFLEPADIAAIAALVDGLRGR